MDKRLEVIIECIKAKRLDKKDIARALVEAKHYDDIETARRFVRGVLGSAGRPVSKRYAEIYDMYMETMKADDQYYIASQKKLKDSRVYIITSALNNTPVHEKFWRNLLKYAEFRGAEVHVIAIRYKNPTSVWTNRQQAQEVWAPELVPYLDANHHVLFDKYHLMGNIKIQPTASLPLSGMNGMTGPESCIFGHTRIHMKYMPTLGYEPKMMITTGSCTVPSYTDSKAGAKGEFHHTLGFVIATEDDLHYVSACSDGSFIDYDTEVKDELITYAEPAQALIYGDIHYSKLLDEDVSRMYERAQRFQPGVIVLHDVFDGESCNPHTEKNPIEKVKRYRNGIYSVEDEIRETLQFLREVVKWAPEVVLVSSNHDTMLDRYIASMDWRKDINNAVQYAELLQIALREDVGVFAYLASQIEGLTVLGPDDSYIIDGIEVGQHGDKGANGTRGSLQQFKSLSTKMWKAHDHTPAREDGVSSVGVQRLRHGYNVGFSSWGIADGLITANGKSQHVF